MRTIATRRVVTSLGVLAVALGLLLLGLWSAAADAQGAVALFFLGGPAIALTVGALILARESRRLGARIGAMVSGLSAGLALVLQVALFGCAFVPACEGFPHRVIGAVSSAYETLTGESPYSRAHRP